MYESDIEQLLIETLLANLGFTFIPPEELESERDTGLSKVLLEERLLSAIEKLNPDIPKDAKDYAIKLVKNLSSQNLINNNEEFHKYLTDGVSVEYSLNGEFKSSYVKLIDFQNIENNEFIVTNQFTVIEKGINKRPDVVIFINGLPLVVIELKNAADENATLEKAYQQLQTYKNVIPSLFNYNEILIASDGLDAIAGTISSDYSRFTAWKTSDGSKEDNIFSTAQIETLAKGMLNKQTLLDLINHFIVFEKSKKINPDTEITNIVTIKKIAQYHQYYAVNKAIESTLKATAEDGDRKAGIFWHTQGSGKSLSMIFYTGKLVLELDNPTVVVINDRNDLDGQLYDTFAGAKQLLRQDPIQAESRTQLKELLKTSGGGIIFTTIQKFFPEDGQSNFDLLSNRKNIIVIADEAHRSQYGFAGKISTSGELRYGFAKYLRDALPNASFIGFTGTPVEKEDASTPAVFGNYIDIYDISRAVEDHATVPIFYESRLVKVHLKPEEAKKLDEEMAAISEGDENTLTEKAKAKWTQFEAIVGHKERLVDIAKDIVMHFEARRETLPEGKAMIVTMSRRIAVELYEEIIKIKPEWHSNDLKTGKLKVVMTSASSDPDNWQPHHTNKIQRQELADRFKNPSDELKLVIVRDMWLTGFDAPCLDTMYVDKLMQGANLMQAIARVNRIYKDKPAGLIVDYIGFASSLKEALAVYTENGGEGKPTFDINEALAIFEEKLEIVQSMFSAFDYKKYFTADISKKLSLILQAQEYILGLEDGKNRFIKNITELSKAFSLCVPQPQAMLRKEEVALFQAIKARLVKFEITGSGKSIVEIESAIRQLVDRAVVSEGIINIFDAAGIAKPDISILSDEFLNEVKGMEHKNLAVELLKKLLNDEIKSRQKLNLIQSKKFSERLEDAIKRYQNNLITAVQVIEELIKIAKEIHSEDEQAKQTGLTNYELAFYSALANNDSAKEVLGNDILRELAMALVRDVKGSATIDWTIKESVKSKLRVIVKRLLRRYGYPPDLEQLATDNILKQAELFADDWSKVTQRF